MNPGQLPLRQGIEKIALILSGIQGLFQEPAARPRVPAHPGIVPGGHVKKTRRLRRLQQPGKLHTAVAVHTGIGGSSRLIDPDKSFNDGLLKFPDQVQLHERNAKPPADGLRVGGVSPAVRAQQPHGSPLTVEAPGLHEIGRRRAVHTAAHGNQRALILALPHSVPPLLVFSDVIIVHFRRFVTHEILGPEKKRSNMHETLHARFFTEQYSLFSAKYPVVQRNFRKKRRIFCRHLFYVNYISVSTFLF